MRGGTERVEIEGSGGVVFDALAAGPAGGELVLLLHGFPQSSATWVPQLDALAGAGYRAVAPDQRGYSPRARPEGKEHYRIGQLVGDVVDMADRLGADRFHVVGHDWGAVVAWHLAGRHAGRLLSLTALSVPHPIAFVTALLSADADQRGRSSYITFFQQVDVAEDALLGGGLAALLTASGYPPDGGECVARMSEPGALTAALNWYRAIDLGLVTGVRGITVPTMFVWSTGDVALGRAAAEATGAHVAGPYRFEVLDGVSHWIPEEAPAVLTGLLLGHLASAAA
ncbi:MAG: alpha/beta hydrolase [Actinomycetota bacterium]|nr:alpha/beta hydrolase [Actinomycetota bacterium]